MGVVDRVIGERGELLGSVGSRGHGAHRGEGVDGLFSFGSETEEGEFI